MPTSDSTEALRHDLAKVFCAIGVNVDLRIICRTGWTSADSFQANRHSVVWR